MAKHPWLLERKEKDGTHRFYLRAKVPVDLIGIIGKKEIKRSLKTGDRKEARQRIDIEAAKLKQEFSDARRKLNNQPQTIAALSETDLQRMVLLWFHRAECRSAGENIHALTDQEFEAVRDNLHHTEAALNEPDDPSTLASVQAQADAILIDAGWPANEHRLGALEGGTGADADNASPEYHRLCELVHGAMLERVRRDHSRLRGEAVGTAYDPIFARVTATTPPESLKEIGASPPLSEILGKWISERQPPEKTLREWKTAVRRFKEVSGSDLPVASINKGHVREFKDALLKLPGVLTHKLRERTMPEIIAATEGSDAQRLSPQAVKKQIAAISTLLSWAESNGHREGNPASGITVATAKNAPRPRHPYSVDDMRLILNSLPQFRERQPSRFWVPILALYTGARMNELGQLELADVRERDGIAYIDISAEGDGKSLKTKSSVREVSIHPELIRIGFLEYVAKRRKKVGKALFPDLKPDSIGNLTGNLSKWYGRHVRKIGITDPRKVFHSFRHTFKDACRAARISEEVHDTLTGHSGGGVGRTYGGGVPLDVKAEAIAKITYDGVDGPACGIFVPDWWFVETSNRRRPSMSSISVIGLDIAKNVFQVHGADESGAVVMRRQLRRGQMLGYFAGLPPCLIGLEACATGHYWGRELRTLGHDVRLIPPQYVKPYVKRNKADAADAEAICEAVGRPSMHFVGIKSAEQQAVLALHRTRDLLVRQRTMAINALRGHMAEFGVVEAQGIAGARRLMAVLADEGAKEIRSLLSKARRALKAKVPNPDKALDFIDKALEAHAGEMAWRAQAKTALLPGLEAYEAAIRDTIGLRQQSRLPEEQVKEIVGCLSQHRDISLYF